VQDLTMSTSETAPTMPSRQSRAAAGWAWAALVMALAGLVGSLALSLALGLKACPLCFYQRTFMMSVAAVLATGLVAGIASPGRLCVLALPLAIAGLGVAGFHVWLEVSGKLECPPGLRGVGTAPQQSLAAFAVLSVLLIAGVWRGSSDNQLPWAGLIGVIAVGVLLTVASVIANPPIPKAPSQSYDKPPDACREPVRAS
jgi:disulfide bond formation protein DsbB